MSVGKRLRDAREAAGLTQQQVADLFGITRVAVAKWEVESGGNLPEADKLPALARRFKKSIDWILTGKEVSGNTEGGPDLRGRVPIINWVQAGDWMEVVDNDEPGVAEDWAETTVPVRRHTYALRVRGDSMKNPSGEEPSFLDGQVVVVEPDAIAEPPALVGKFVIVKRAGDQEATFKQLVRDGDSFFLKPLNPQYPLLELRDGDVFCGVVTQKVVRY